MAETNINMPMDKPKYPHSVNTEDSDDQLIVTLEIPNMKVERKFYFFGEAEPKPGESVVTGKIERTSLEVKVTVLHEGRTTQYEYKVKTLPGEIDEEKSYCEYYAGKLKLTLVKQVKRSWNSFLKHGLL